MLSSIAPAVTKVHTDGVGVRALKKSLFIWEHSERVINYTKWWPEWNGTLTANPNLSNEAQCIILRNQFRYRSECAHLPYFYW